MTAKRQVTLVAASVLALSLALSVVFLGWIDEVRSEATLEEILYIPSPRMVKRMALGYDGLMADIYWTRAVQYFGGKHVKHSQQYQLLQPLLDITTELDPHLIVAYRFGAVFLAQAPPEGAGDPDAAVALVERGIRANPNEWRLYNDLGYIHYMERADYAQAVQAFERGSRVPNAHPFLKVMAATIAQKGGEIATARMLWRLVLETTEDQSIRGNAIRRLRALEVDETVPRLEATLQAFQTRFGRLPQNWSELVSSGLLRAIPVDPLGYTYKLMPDGRVEVRDPDALPFIQAGLPPGRKSKWFYTEAPAPK